MEEIEQKEGFLSRMKNVFVAFMKGELLFRLHFDKYFIHIIYTFFLFWISIWLSLKVEQALTLVEDNKTILNELKIQNAQKTVKLVSLNRLTTIKSLLEKDSSKVTIPQKPAMIIKTK